MTRDEIIKLALDAGGRMYSSDEVDFFLADLERFAAALAKTVPSDCSDSHQPVAWIHTDPDKPRVKFLEWREDEPGYRGRWIKTPLYTAPPQRKPLTDGEIGKVAAPYYGTMGFRVEAFARAIERAHGIGVDS